MRIDYKIFFQMKKQFFLLLLFTILINLQSQAQLVVTNGLTPQQLANRIAGPGVSVSNVTLTGNATMAASFTANGTNLGITDGVMLCTGPANLMVGPNSLPDAGLGMGLPGNPYLDSIANVITADACVLEFDFVSQSAMVSFRYVFGSEEFPEYVCSDFNDLFAFLISGPGIFGTLNMALIPGTSTPVAINAVNGGVVGASGYPGPHCVLTNTGLYTDNTNGATIELDGFTILMTARAIVQPCQTYHLRIMIADALDDIYDSGVFLEAGSLVSIPTINAGADQTICSDDSVMIGLSPIAGYTYSWTPSSGLNNPNISNPTVHLTNNGIAPISYAYTLVADNGSCLLSDTVTVTVNPAAAAAFTVTPAQACVNEALTINYTGTSATSYVGDFGSATVLSGSSAGPYQISYSSAQQDSIEVIASSGACTGRFSSAVGIKPIPVAIFSSPPAACQGDTISVNYTGVNPNTVICNWNFDNASILSGNNSGPYLLSFNSSGIKNISLTVSDSGCISNATNAAITINQIPLALAGSDVIVCSDEAAFLGSPNDPALIYSWSPIIGLNFTAVSDPVMMISNTGNAPVNYGYRLQVVAASGGCVATDSVSVIVNPTVNVDFIPAPAQCFENNSFDFSVQGSYPAGSIFQWDFSSDATPSVSNQAIQQGVTFNVVGSFPVSLSASFQNCIMPTVIHNVVVSPQPTADFVSTDLSACSPLNARLSNLSSDTSNTFLWLLSDGTVSTEINPVFELIAPGMYDVSLTATNVAGCTVSEVKQKYFTVFASPVSSFIAEPTTATIEIPLINFHNNSHQADFYQWDFGDSTFSQEINASHIYGSTGIFNIRLIAINNSGCVDTSYGTIEINEGLSFFVPNSFTPNGDGVNDYFQGYGINFTSYQLQIFNRWGDKIYESNDYLKPWDGKIKGAVQNEVYVYKINVIDKFREIHNYIGSVTVAK